MVALCVGRVAGAQEFSLYLHCAGQANQGGQMAPAHVDLALRFNSQTALVQASNVLPVGERLHYDASPVAYAMTYRLPKQGTEVWVVPGWLTSTVFVKWPNLSRLNEIRLSIDRHNGQLEGAMLNEEAATLATLSMTCAKADTNLPARF